jgi:hypothetical protein
MSENRKADSSSEQHAPVVTAQAEQDVAELRKTVSADVSAIAGDKLEDQYVIEKKTSNEIPQVMKADLQPCILDEAIEEEYSEENTISSDVIAYEISHIAYSESMSESECEREGLPGRKLVNFPVRSSHLLRVSH